MTEGVEIKDENIEEIKKPLSKLLFTHMETCNNDIEMVCSYLVGVVINVRCQEVKKKYWKN
jgi:hypothetical protein